MSMFKAIAATFVLLAAFTASAHAQTPAPNGDGRRVALVIGNQTYGSLGPLINPVRDAKAVSGSLRTAGFATVVEATDLNIEAFQRTLREFRRVADGASIAVVYFAGHGMEMYGKNWLIPLAANIAKPEDLPLETIPLDTVLTAMGGATTKVLILDACRNNPFERAIRLGAGAAVRSNNQGSGLAPINQAALPNGMLVMYATEPGATASDGLPTDTNSPFARALMAELPTRGVDVRLVAGGVTERTMELTQQEQRPFVTALLGRAPVYIAGEATQPPVTAPPVVATPVAQTSADATRMLARARAAGVSGDCQALLDLQALLPAGDTARQAQTAAQECRTAYLDRLTVPNRPLATEADLRQLAAQYGLEAATFMAVSEVESGRFGSADANGRPIITFEPHLFSRHTQRRYDVSHPAISTPTFNPALYPRDQNGRWAQLRAAYALDPEAAVSATSWGRFQILGQNFRAVGYGSATEFVAEMSKSEMAQYRALVAFSISHNLLDDLQRRDFEGFARGYNGMGQVERYTQLLRAAYVRHGGDAATLPAASPPRAPFDSSTITYNLRATPALRAAPPATPAQPLRPLTSAALTDIVKFGFGTTTGFTELADALNRRMPEYGVNTPQRAAHFLAQIGREACQNLDCAGGKALEGNAALGNTQTGDGVKYRARGLLPIAGRAAYRAYGQAIGVDLEANPDQLKTPDVAARVALVYWTRGYPGETAPNTLADRDDIAALWTLVRVNGAPLRDTTGTLQAAKRFYGVAYTGIEIPNLGEPAPFSPAPWLAIAFGALGLATWTQRRRA